MARRWWLPALLAVWISGAMAQPIQVGKPLPLTIAERGKLVLHDDDIVYRPWQSDSVDGKVTFLMYLAGRKSADDINHHVTDVLDAAKFPPARLRSVTLVNAGDAAWMTGGFVASELEKEKRKHPQATLVLDKDGNGRKAWDLKHDSSAIMVLDKTGKVLFFKDGRLSDEETDHVMSLIRERL